jgi:hypothetical protein
MIRERISKLSDEQHKTRDTVWVICRLPHGLIIYPEIERDGDPIDGSGRHPRVSVEIPEQRIKLNGANSSTVIGRNGRTPGYGMTEVDRGVWERWIATHADFPAVMSGAITMQETRAPASPE